MKLYSYFRSSASFRARIALALKGIEYETVPIHLLKNEQLSAQFRAISPDGLVPVLVDGDVVINQSLAICAYLDETHPDKPLLPGSPVDRAQIRSLALAIACEIHPLNNLRVLRYLNTELKVEEAARDKWYRHWVEEGLAAYETQLLRQKSHGRFSYGDTPTLADVCLVPQIFNARRVNSDLSGVPTVMKIFEECMALEAFQKAQPSAQPDAVA